MYELMLLYIASEKPTCKWEMFQNVIVICNDKNSPNLKGFPRPRFENITSSGGVNTRLVPSEMAVGASLLA